MKESYREDLAGHSGLEPYAGSGNIAGVASARGNAGQLSSSEITTSACRSCPDTEKATSSSSSEITTSACRSCPDTEKATSSMPLFGEAATDAAESKNLCMRRHSKRENREILLVSAGATWHVTAGAERSENVSDGNPDMNANRKSDGLIVPAKRTNKAGTPAAESVEERGSPKGNAANHAPAPDSVPGFAG